MMKKILSSALITGALAVSGASYEIPEVTLPLMQKAPTIDGKIEPGEWQYAAGMWGTCWNFKKPGWVFPAEMVFYVGADAQNLYIAVRSEVGPMGLLQKVRSLNGDPFGDDSIETLIIPDMSHPNTFYHTNINNRGISYRTAAIEKEPVPFNGKWEVKGMVSNGLWEFESAISWKDLGLDGPPEDTGLRIGRNWKRTVYEWVQTAWEPVKARTFTNLDIPVIHWQKDAPSIQVDNLLRGYSGSMIKPADMTVFNPAAQDVKLKMNFQFRPGNSQQLQHEETYTLKAGERRVIPLPGGEAHPSEDVTWKLLMTSVDGKTVFYRREFNFNPWEKGKDRDLWLKDDGDEQRANVNFSHYPTYRKLILRMDLSGVKNLSALEAPKVLVKTGGRLVAEVPMPMVDKQKQSSLVWDTPDFSELIPAGKEAIDINLEYCVGGKKIAEKKFYFHRPFEWLGNNIGMSDIVVPPFTEVQYSSGIFGLGDKNVSVLLRDYTLNSLGLPAQVNAKGRDILKGKGVTLEAVIDGETFEAQGDLKKSKQGKTYLETNSAWSAGALEGDSHCAWDQDGFMKWTLTLKPGVKLDSLKLRIPLDDAQCPLMHTIGDGHFLNFAGATPSGEGLVWDDAKAAKNKIRQFVPYVWLGGDYRGFSVCGNNDKGWLVKSDTKEFSLYRDNGVLTLVLNLADGPAEVKEPRAITLGFMASPVKSPPDDWRLWGMWNWQEREVLKDYITWKFNFLGHPSYWGGDECRSYCPLNHDIEVLNKMGEARRTGITPKAWLEEWCKNGPQNSSAKDRYKSLVHGFGRAMGDPKNDAMFYFDSRGADFTIEEGKHYFDEWQVHEFADITKMPEEIYGGKPSATKRDFAAYWQKKMLDSGAMNQVYYDVIDLCPDFSAFGNDAYCRADGTIQPDVGFFDMRELMQRSAKLCQEQGFNPRMMIHMTSENALPIISYGKVNMDWEENLGGVDCQDRHSREWIRAMSHGRQSGNVGYMIITHSVPPAQYPNYKQWVRSCVGVILTFEMRWMKVDSCYTETIKRLYEFGYGKPEAQVFNYWDENYPVSFPGKETSSLTTLHNGQALVMVCDWDNGGEYTMVADIDKLNLKPGFKAFNVETGAQLPVEDNKIKFKMGKHDFMLIKLK